MREKALRSRQNSCSSLSRARDSASRLAISSSSSLFCFSSARSSAKAFDSAARDSLRDFSAFWRVCGEGAVVFRDRRKEM